MNVSLGIGVERGRLSPGGNGGWYDIGTLRASRAALSSETKSLFGPSFQEVGKGRVSRDGRAAAPRAFDAGCIVTEEADRDDPSQSGGTLRRVQRERVEEHGIARLHDQYNFLGNCIERMRL